MTLVLNVGSGEVHDLDAVNVDVRAVADIQADIRTLPYADHSVDELRAIDVLEHLPEQDYPDALAEWARVLKPGGRLIVRVPNMYALCVQIAARADQTSGAIESLIRNVYGGHKWPDVDAHHWGWTPATLTYALHEHGFDVAVNDHALNMRVEAVRRP